MEEKAAKDRYRETCRKLNTKVKTILFSNPKKSTQRSNPMRSYSRKMIPRMWINKRLYCARPDNL